MQQPLVIDTPISQPHLDDGPWRAARARLQLYVAALRLPQAQANRLCEAALAQARASEPVVPLAAAMAALQALAQQQPSSPTRAMPPLTRRGMRPERIRRAAVGAVLAGLLRPLIEAATRRAQLPRHRFLLVCLTATAGLLLPRLG